MINCTRKPYSPLSCHNPFVFLLKHIVFYHIVIYDFLQKMRDFLIPSFSPASLLLFEVTDFYVYMLSQGVCIFFQYYKRRNPASALESRQIRWQHSHNVCDLLLSHILAMSFLHQLLNDFWGMIQHPFLYFLCIYKYPSLACFLLCDITFYIVLHRFFSPSPGCFL